MVQLNGRAPRVTVITIFLNEERFLGETIASVQAQTFADWELILVDDGSTDSSPDIARAAAARDPRIRLVSHPNGENRGMSASRNRGMAEARGEFVAFIDGDDDWLPGKLAEQVAIFDRVPEAEMVYGRTLFWYSWDPDARLNDYCQTLGVTPDRLYHAPALFRMLMENRAQPPTTNNAIMRRSLIERVGGFEDDFRTMFEDQVFYAKTHLTASIWVSDALWARYRKHQQSCTAQTPIAQEMAAQMRYLRWVSVYLRRVRPGAIGLRFAVMLGMLRCQLRPLRARVGQLLGRKAPGVS